MSSTVTGAGDPQSLPPPPPPPPVDVRQSIVSINDHKNDEIDANQVNTNVIEEDLDDKSTDSSQNSVIMTKTDLLGLENSGTAVNDGDYGGVTDATTEVKSKKSVIMTKIDLLGLGNSDLAVNDGDNGGVTDATTEVTSKKPVQISPDRMRGGESYRYEKVYDFPPDLSTLKRNGRQRFDLVTVRENGRLQIFMVPNRWPLLVRSPLKDGRLRMWLLDDDQCGGDHVWPPAPPYGGGQVKMIGKLTN